MKLKPCTKLHFQVGDVVDMPPDLYGCTRGFVREVTRTFHEVLSNGEFDEYGLTTDESIISSFQVPYLFDGETLQVLHEKDKWRPNDEVSISKHYGWSCTVQTEQMNVLINQVALKLVSRKHPWPKNKKHLLK